MLDSWMITDASDRWNFRVTVEGEHDGTRPEKDSDVYDADTMGSLYKTSKGVTRQESERMADWARRAVKAWEDDLWQFVTVSVVPVSKVGGAEFPQATASVGRCDYGWLPGDADGAPGTWTDGRPYVRQAWANDLISEATDGAEKALKDIKEGTK